MTTDSRYRLAPLQRLMLQDSLADDGHGRHVEQVEIVFSQEIARERIISAWRETVAGTEALRVAFVGEALEVVFMEPADFLRIERAVPDAWQDWLDADRVRPLLVPDEVPWRAAFWPLAGRFIWTFHHALLDGRSIARVLSGFLQRVAGEASAKLALAKWREPSRAELELAMGIFRDVFEGLQPAAFDSKPDSSLMNHAVCYLGNDFVRRLESMATAMDLTTATLITWAWGQALAEASDADAVMVEQVRAGTPQTGTAGFTMNTLPVLIHRADDVAMRKNLREFRIQLLGLREIEAVSAKDFPPGIFPDTNRPGSSVFMVERGTLRHMTGPVAQREWLESLVLHEDSSGSLTATAHILPDLRLQVEGPGRQGLLAKWVVELEKLVSSGTGLGS